MIVIKYKRFSVLIIAIKCKRDIVINNFVEYLGHVRLIEGQFWLNVNNSSEEIMPDLVYTRQMYQNISSVCKECLLLHPDILSYSSLS